MSRFKDKILKDPVMKAGYDALQEEYDKIQKEMFTVNEQDFSENIYKYLEEIDNNKDFVLTIKYEDGTGCVIMSMEHYEKHIGSLLTEDEKTEVLQTFMGELCKSEISIREHGTISAEELEKELEGESHV